MKPTGKSLVTMRQALEDPQIFGRILEGPSWGPWRTAMIASRGEKLITKTELKTFTALSGRTTPPHKPVRRFTCCVGRRGGKTRSQACYAAYLAALVDWRDVIVKGETGTVLIVANTTAQA